MLDPVTLITGIVGGGLPAIAGIFAQRSKTRRALEDCEQKHEDCTTKVAAMENRVAILEGFLSLKDGFLILKPSQEPERT